MKKDMQWLPGSKRNWVTDVIMLCSIVNETLKERGQKQVINPLLEKWYFLNWRFCSFTGLKQSDVLFKACRIAFIVVYFKFQI